MNQLLPKTIISIIVIGVLISMAVYAENTVITKLYGAMALIAATFASHILYKQDNYEETE